MVGEGSSAVTTNLPDVGGGGACLCGTAGLATDLSEESSITMFEI